MKKFLKIAALLSVLAAVTGYLQAQDVEFSAATKSNVQVGEQFRAVYTVNQQVDKFEGPDFEGFSILSGPNQSTSQSYQFINGKVSQSYQLTFTYYLQALNEGSFQIKPAKVVTGSKTYESNGLTVNVTKGAASPPPNQQGGQRQGASSTQSGTGKDDVFVRAFADKTRPFQGEQVIITYRIYTTVPVSQINVSKISSFPGFWSKSLLNDNDPLRQSTEVVNGKEYVVADLRKIAVFAQRSGEIKIEPMEIECVAQLKVQNNRQRDPFFDNFFNDPFFNRNFQNVELKVESNPLTIDVKPLPSAGTKLNFSGAVGSFNLSSELDRTELKTNEPLNLKITITGKGNLELIDALPIAFPPDFETYDPKITNNISKNQGGLSGSRVFEYLIIPRNPGTFEIKPVDFTYFDPAKQDYITFSTPRYTIRVDKGPDEPSGISYSGISQKNIEFIGTDIRHIKTGETALKRQGHFLIGSASFYLWLIVPAMLTGIAIYLGMKNRQRSSNVALVRNRKANKVARKNLRKASLYLESQQTEAFFEEISRALWGYIGNKFNIPLSDLSIDTVHQKLSDKRVSETIIAQFTTVLENCEYARFAPGDKSEKMQGIYNEALEVISKIEQELK